MGLDIQSISAITFNDAGLEPTITLGTNSANSDGIVNGDFPNLPSGSTGDAIVTRAKNVFADITGFLGSAGKTLNIVSPSPDSPTRRTSRRGR